MDGPGRATQASTPTSTSIVSRGLSLDLYLALSAGWERSAVSGLAGAAPVSG